MTARRRITVGERRARLAERHRLTTATKTDDVAAIADSVVGATLQDRRWCDTCQTSTERAVHGCGTPTRHAGGITAVDNDLVNLIATVAGAAVAALLVHLALL